MTKQNEEEEKSEQKELGWWFSQNSPIGYDAWDITDYDYGFEDSLNYINKVFESQGPFDGIFAFVFVLYFVIKTKNQLSYFFTFNLDLVKEPALGQYYHESHLAMMKNSNLLDLNFQF